MIASQRLRELVCSDVQGSRAVALALWKQVLFREFDLKDATYTFTKLGIAAGIEVALTISLSCVPFLRLLCLKGPGRPKDARRSRPKPHYFSSDRLARQQEEGLPDDPWTRQLHDIDDFVAVPRQCASAPFSHDTRASYTPSTKGHWREVSDSTNSIIVQTSWEVTTEEQPSGKAAGSLAAEDEEPLEKCPTIIYEGADLPFLGGDLETSGATTQASDDHPSPC